MARDTGISWTDSTWNPVRGCSRISKGCENCYAERMAARFSDPGKPYHGYAEMTPSGPRWTGKLGFIERHINDPLNWKKPARIFVNSTSDLFHEDMPWEWIEKVFGIMLKAKWHTFQVLTKRADKMRDWMNEVKDRAGHLIKASGSSWPPNNVHLGVSVEDQAAATKRIPSLMGTPAYIRFLSVEPLIGPVDLGSYLSTGRIDWVIAGAESGPGARPMQEDWVRVIRDQCVRYNVKLFYKQKITKDGKKIETPKIDGRRWTQFPTRKDTLTKTFPLHLTG